jgi:hypothetical protein
LFHVLSQELVQALSKGCGAVAGSRENLLVNCKSEIHVELSQKAPPVRNGSGARPLRVSYFERPGLAPRLQV